MRKILVLISTALLMMISAPALQADAAVVKTTITVTPPAYVFAGVPNPIDVAVCGKSTLYAPDCVGNDYERSVTLWANGQKVQTVSTVGGGGQANFTWTPKYAGPASLKVTVAARSGMKALTSETKKVTVRAKAQSTSLGTRSCGTVCVQGIPNRLNLNLEEVITAGVISGVVKGRKIHFQTLRVNNTYVDKTSATTSWQSDIGRYGIAISFADIDQFSDCTAGGTVTWNYRFLVDATSKSPGAVTKAKWIDVVCPVGSGSDGDIQMTVDYSNQDMDYSNYSPDDISVSISAPDDAQYSIYSMVCSDSDDCSDDSNWYQMDGYSQADGIFGSQVFSLNADPGDYGTYWVKVEVIPWTNQDIFYSDWYKVTLW